MEKNKDEMLAELQRKIEELPEKAQQAMYWTITHFDFIKDMCGNPGMTNEEIEKYKKDAYAKGDYTMLAPLCAAQAFNNSSETTEQ